MAGPWPIFTAFPPSSQACKYVADESKPWLDRVSTARLSAVWRPRRSLGPGRCQLQQTCPLVQSRRFDANVIVGAWGELPRFRLNCEGRAMSRKLCLSLGLLLLGSVPAFAQQTAPTGYTACPGGEAYVFMYQSPTDFTVLANLHCGTKLEILGKAGAYVAVRTADGKQGYVPQSAVTMATAPPPAAPAMEKTFTSSEKPARAASAGPFFRECWARRGLRRIFLPQYGFHGNGWDSAAERKWLSGSYDAECQSMACRRGHF